MTINKLNYEAFLLDFAEGNLSAEEVSVLNDFIKKHPELGSWEDLTAELPVLKASEMTFAYKSSLKVYLQPDDKLEINSENFDWFAISYLENELDTKDRQQFEHYLKTHKARQKEFLILKRTILQADKSIQFEGKNALKKAAGLKAAMYMPWAAVAAGLLLLISLGWWFGREHTKPADFSTPMLSMNSIRPVQIETEPASEKTLLLEKPEIKKPEKLMPEINFSEKPLIIQEMAFAEAKPFSWTPVASLFYTDDSKTLYFFYDGQSILAELNARTAVNQKSLVGLVLSNLAEKITSSLRRAGTTEEPVIIESFARNSPKYSLIKLAEMGVKTYNAMTDNELALEKTVNEKGELNGLRFHSESISISRRFPVSKEQR